MTTTTIKSDKVIGSDNDLLVSHTDVCVPPWGSSENVFVYVSRRLKVDVAFTLHSSSFCMIAATGNCDSVYRMNGECFR